MEFDVNYLKKQGYKEQKKWVIGIKTCKFIQFTSFFTGFVTMLFLVYLHGASVRKNKNKII